MLARGRSAPSATWVNQRVIYTHGIGMAMVPVNEVTREGQPRLWIRDLPLISTSGVPLITEPRIYFGETETTGHHRAAGSSTIRAAKACRRETGERRHRDHQMGYNVFACASATSTC